MLDTHARKYVEPLFEKSARKLLKLGLTANQVTLASFVIGVSTGPLIYLEYTWLAVAALWVSGFLDAVDGTMARLSKPSAWGTVLDVSLDRVVEISVILGLAIRFPDVMWALLLLSVSIIFAMTVFLTVGAVTGNQGVKTFHYPTGLAERTEGFILFTLMMVLTDLLLWLTLLFLFVEIFTALQRMLHARKHLKGR